MHGVDAGLDRHTLLLNVSLSFQAPLRVELWRHQGTRPLVPPMLRRALRCGQHVLERRAHQQPPDVPQLSSAQAPEFWAISNDWDTWDPLAAVGQPSDPLGDAASSKGLWTCADGEQGALELHPAPTLGRLVSVTLDSHLVPPQSATATPAEGGNRSGYITVAAAWDQMCDMEETEDAPPGAACRTVFTVSRIPVVSVFEPCWDDQS